MPGAEDTGASARFSAMCGGMTLEGVDSKNNRTRSMGPYTRNLASSGAAIDAVDGGTMLTSGRVRIRKLMVSETKEP